MILANRETWANLSQDERHDRRPVPGAVPAHLPLAHAANREIGRWSNPSIYAGILAVLTLQLAFVALAPMHDIFDSALPDVAALLLALLGSLLVFPVTWLEERWRVRRLTAPATADTGADDR